MRWHLLVIVALVGSGNVDAQSVIAANAAATCSTCTIVSRPVAEIGRTDGPGALVTESPLLSRDRRGRFYVHGGPVEGLLVYDSTGRFLRVVGRRGAGPGEYEGAVGVIAIAGDSLVIVDGTLNRMTVLNPDYSVARTLTMTVRGDRPVLPSPSARQIVVNASDARRGNVTYVVDIVSGNTVRSFGDMSGTTRAAIPEGGARSMASANDGSLWISYLSRYTIERWSTDGRRLSTLTRNVSWFPAYRHPDEIEPGEPQTVIMSIDADAQGRLWVLLRVPDSRWREAIRVVPNRRFPEVTDPLRHTDTMLEVIDPATGHVLLSQRYDQAFTSFLPGQYLVEPRPDNSGRPLLHITRVELRER